LSSFSYAGRGQEALDDPVGIEVLLGDASCGPGVQCVILPYCLDGVRRFGDCSHGEQAPAGRQQVLKTGGLKDDRPAGGQLTGPAVAEPATPGADVPALGTAEFAARTLHVFTVAIRAAHDLWTFDAPAVIAQASQVRVFRLDVQRDLQRLPCQLR